MFSLPRPLGGLHMQERAYSCTFAWRGPLVWGDREKGELCTPEPAKEKRTLNSLLLFTYSCQSLTNVPGVSKQD